MEYRSEAMKSHNKANKQSHWKRNMLIVAFGAATCLALDGYIQVKAAVNSVKSAVHGFSTVKNLVAPSATK